MPGKYRPSRQKRADERRKEYRIKLGVVPDPDQEGSRADDVDATGGETLAPPAPDQEDAPAPSVTDADMKKFMVNLMGKDKMLISFIFQSIVAESLKEAEVQMENKLGEANQEIQKLKAMIGMFTAVHLTELIMYSDISVHHEQRIEGLETKIRE